MSDWEDIEAEEQVIEDEHQIWLENKKQIYGTILEQKMSIPHLTFQWLPGSETSKGVTKQKIVMGTYTEDDGSGEQKQQKLQIAEVEYINSGDKQPDETMGQRITTKKLLDHEGDINKARYMPTDANKIATISGTGAVYLFDVDEGIYTKLSGHTENGFGLAWHDDKLLTGADDGVVCLWNAETGGKPTTWKHNEGINDVCWQSATMFGAVTEDAYLNIYDPRQKKAVQVSQPHEAPVNSLSFNHYNQNLLLTASHDKTVALFDLRYMGERLNSFMDHGKPVDSVEWSPHSDKVFASTSRDRRVCLWNISRIGEEMPPDDVEDASPELMFMHGGHQGIVNDMGWNPENEWVIGSLDNECLQIWRPIDSIVGNVDIRPTEDELEYSQ